MEMTKILASLKSNHSKKKGFLAKIREKIPAKSHKKTLQPIIKRPPRITSHQQLKHFIEVLIGNEIGNDHEDILPKRFFFFRSHKKNNSREMKS